MKKRMLSLLLVLLLSGSYMLACSEKAPETDTPATGTTAVETQEIDPLDALGTFDFEGDTFRTVYCEGFFFSPYAVEAENGELLNDEAYRRNQAMEERYHVSMEYYVLNGSGNEATQAIIKSVTANDQDYSLGIVHPFIGLTGLISGGYTYDWNKVPHVNFSQEWWNQSFNRELAIGSILPCASSDFIYFNSGAIYFNKRILANINLENPYDLVRSGNWTWDKLGEMSAAAYADLNGSSSRDDGDQYGYSIAPNHRMVPVSYSCGLITSSLDEDGYPVVENMGSEKAVDIVNMYYQLLYENDGTWIAKGNELAPFMEDRVLFLHYVTQNAKALRDLEFEFGILPQPKFDARQEDYYSLAQSNVMVIPSNYHDPDMAGVLVEALSIYSNRYVLPALYENTFNYKYLRDEDSIEMFNIIKNSLVYDKLWNYAEGHNAVYFITNLMNAKSTNLISYYKSNQKSAEKVMQKLYDDVLNG